jgi:hypothetical protein
MRYFCAIFFWLFIRFVSSIDTKNILIKRNLPIKFAAPVTLEYDDTNNGARILGPVSHGTTVSMSVSPSNSRIIAVTGWTTIDSNNGSENIFLTNDAGQTWINITNNLKEATNVVGQVRPSSLLIVDLLQNKDKAILVGTSNGIMVTYISQLNLNTTNDGGAATWSRFGDLSEFPIVLNSGLSYEHYSDKIVAATFGRGIYIVDNAKESLLTHRDRFFMKKNRKRIKEESSAKYFPKQK